MTITNAPAPWTCKCESYWLLLSLKDLPQHSYSPLEAVSSFADLNEAGKFVGGFGYIQIVRYTESPVGPYDELLIIPGEFESPASNVKSKKNVRVTRIYVSQEDTCYNGRKNWNIPKHLARFEFSHPISSTSSPIPKVLTVKVYAHDPSASEPFFTATLQPFRWMPSIPFSTKILPYLGLDSRLMQPPLPASEDTSRPELCGTTKWQLTNPYLYSPRMKGMWVNAEQPGKDGEDAEATKLHSWWPDAPPMRIGFWLEEATLAFPVPETLELLCNSDL